MSQNSISQKQLLFAQIFGFTFLFLLSILHFLKPEISVNYRLISEYEIGNYGFLMRIAFLSWGTGFLCLSLSVWNVLTDLTGKIAKYWLLIISIAIICAGIFVTQPITDIVRTQTDRIHAICGAMMIFTFPIVATLFTRSLSKIESFKDEKSKLFWLTFFVWVGFLSFFASMIVYAPQIKARAYSDAILIGFPNRLMVFIYTIWLIGVSRLLRHIIN